MMHSPQEIPESGAFAATLLAALLWGLVGGFSHCIGMCGIFVLSCGRLDEPIASRRLGRHLLFHAARLVVFAALGAGAGEFGSLVRLVARVGWLQGGFSVACGVFLALSALGYGGLIPQLRIPEPDMMSAGGGAGRRMFVSALRARAWYQPIALGTLVGLLPCGLTYIILIAAASTLSVGRGALVVLSFGLGTIPGLLTLGMLGHLLRGLFQRNEFRLAMTRAGALLMFAMGLILVWRGWPNLF